jgi:catechol 2,3-dioxygenase-like lactoylglutathione lyase family enzyme
MNVQTRLVVAAAAGCLVGSMLTVAVVRGQGGGQKPTPMTGSLSHLGFAVADVEKTAKAFGEVFGVPVPKAQDFRDIPWGPRFPGKTMNVRRIGLDINGVTFELLQPLDGESPWKEFLQKSGDGLHHVGFSVKDVGAARDYLESKGGVQTQAFQTFANYVDMHKAGVPLTFEQTPMAPPKPPAK